MLVNDRVFDKGGPLYDRARESMGNGLVTCPHEGHRKRRRAVQPAFTAERVAVYSRGVAEVLARGPAGGSTGRSSTSPPSLMTMSNAVTVRSVLGGEIAPEAAEHVVEDFDVLVPGMFRRMLMPAALSRLPLQRRYDAAGVRARRTVTEIIAARHDSTTDFGDLLSALEATDGPSGPRTSTDAEMVDDVFAFFLAGTETVASAVAWTMLLIAQHPEIEARLHEEIDRVLDGEQVTYEHLDALGLADAVVTEALRLYPPVWLLTREVTEDAEPRRPAPAGRHHHRLQPVPAAPRPVRVRPARRVRPRPLGGHQAAARFVRAVRRGRPQVRRRAVRHVARRAHRRRHRVPLAAHRRRRALGAPGSQGVAGTPRPPHAAQRPHAGVRTGRHRLSGARRPWACTSANADNRHYVRLHEDSTTGALPGGGRLTG
nr:cytochrome P450 [Angustibacter aerolatus]